MAAADASAAVSAALRNPQNAPWRNAALVFAVGKAAASMMRGAAPVARGIVLLPASVDPGALPPGVEVIRGGHPVPSREGLEASRRVLAEAVRSRRGDRLLVLISGGASSLFEIPRAGVSADSLIETYRLLLGSGAPIAEVNCVRRALSAVKGGGLARAAGAADVLTLAVSDVAGDDPATIGSGPTVLVDDEPREALDAASRHGLASRLPRDVRAVLESAARGASASGPRPECDTAEGAGRFEIVCSAARSVAAASAELQARGYEQPTVADRRGAPERLEGDAVVSAGAVAAAVASALAADAKRTAFVIAGETTVTLPHGDAAGRGGRNSHFAAVVAARLAGRDGFACLCGGTDGIDGASSFAGALVDGGTAARAARAGYDLDTALARFDTATALDRAGDAVRTGPTGTNVGDLLVAVVAPS